MTCEHEILAQRCHDGEATAEERQVFAAHVSQCPTCAALVADLAAMRTDLVAAAEAEPPAQAWRRWRQARGEAQEQSVRRLAGWLSAAAAVVLAAATLASRSGATPPTPAIDPVEVAVLTPDTEPASPTLVAARWMATDLSSAEWSDPR